MHHVDHTPETQNRDHDIVTSIKHVTNVMESQGRLEHNNNYANNVTSRNASC